MRTIDSYSDEQLEILRVKGMLTLEGRRRKEALWLGKAAQEMDYRSIDAPESVKYHGGYDPSDPPRGKHYCAECNRWDDECVCDFEEESKTTTKHEPE